MSVYLSVVADVVAKGNKASLELLGLETACAVLVEVVERQPELIHLVFADALGVTCQDLEVRIQVS